MASITITFTATGESAEDIVIELDEERNKGKTTFAYGDKAYFRVYSPVPYEVYSTAGIVEKVASLSSVEEEFVQFVDSNTARLSKPITGILGTKWFGKSLGTVTKTGTFEVQCSEQVDPKVGKIGIAKVKYSSSCGVFFVSLDKKPEPEYPVLVVVATGG
jgi:hypothetical protein